MVTIAPERIGVRPATLDDIAFMVHLFLQLRYQARPHGDGVDIDAIVHGTRQATRDQVDGRIPHSITSVIEVDGRPSGRLRVIRDAQRIMIGGLQILPSYQNHGIGSSVIGSLIAEASRAGVPLDLEVEKDNPDARRLYIRLGFRQVGETADAYEMRLLPRHPVSNAVSGRYP